MATPQLTSVFELPGKSANIVMQYWKLFAFVSIPSILSALPSVFGADNGPFNPGMSNLSAQEWLADGLIALPLVAIFILVSVFFYAMTTKLCLDVLNRGKEPTVSTLIEAGKKYWLRFLGLLAIMTLAIIGGLFLLIIPGLIIAALLMFAPLILIDKDTTIGEAISGSYKMVTTHTAPAIALILIYVLIIILVAIISAIPFIGTLIGTAISILFSLVLVIRYKELKRVSA